MPELPDVEVWRRTFEQQLRGRRIQDVLILDPAMLDGASAPELGRALKKARLEEVSRRGKFLILRTDSDRHLILHLGMSGRYDLSDVRQPSEHAKLVLRFEGGRQLSYLNQRQFGTIKLARDPNQVKSLRELGPEPLDPEFTAGRFAGMLKERKRTLKPLLMDQSFIAGIGNLYADEILFQAGLRPDRRASELSAEESARLHASMRQVLEEAVAAGADPKSFPKGWLTPNREEGGDCPRCGFPLVRASFSKRAATFCRRCQK